MDRPNSASIPHGIYFHGLSDHMPLQSQIISQLNQFVESTNESNSLFVTRGTTSQSSLSRNLVAFQKLPTPSVGQVSLSRFITKTTTAQSSLSSDIVAFQNQPTTGVGQVSLSRFIANFKRNQSIVDYLPSIHFQRPKDNFPLCSQTSLSPCDIDVLKLERSQFSTSISTRDSFFFLNKQIPLEENCNFDLRNLIWTTSKRNQELPPISAYEVSRDLCFYTSSHNYSLDLSKGGIPVFKINGDVARTPYFPRMKNPVVLWNLPSIQMEKPNFSEIRSYGLSNATLQGAHNWNDKYYGPIQSSARRTRRHQRNNGPYNCPKCQREFAIPQSMAAHMRRHYRQEDQTNRMICSTSTLMKLDNMAAGEKEEVVKQGPEVNVAIKDNKHELIECIKKESI